MIFIQVFRCIAFGGIFLFVTNFLRFLFDLEDRDRVKDRMFAGLEQAIFGLTGWMGYLIMVAIFG